MREFYTGLGLCLASMPAARQQHSAVFTEVYTILPTLRQVSEITHRTRLEGFANCIGLNGDRDHFFIRFFLDHPPLQRQYFPKSQLSVITEIETDGHQFVPFGCGLW